MIREESLAEDLSHLAANLGIKPALVVDEPEDAPYTLAEIYDAEVEEAVKAAYQRDYMMFGFKPWG